jgi:TolB-like protein
MNLEKRTIVEEIDRINASSEFRGKPVMRKLLAYLVTEYVEGRSDQIKGYTIGLDVFGQGKHFDPSRNVLVRNNAVRLRGLLNTYYLGEGKHDPVHIDIPKGGYVPHITRNNGNVASASRTSADVVASAVAVSPFRNISGNKELDYLAIGFARTLTDALAKFDDLRVIGVSHGNDDKEIADELRNNGVGFLVDGEVQAAGTQIKIGLRLVNLADNSQLWGDSVRFNVDRDDLFVIQEEVTERIASRIGGEYGQVNQFKYQVMLNSRPQSLTEQDILLKHYHHVTVLTDESVADFHQAVLEALEQNPDSALLNAIAGGIYQNIWAFSGGEADDALREFSRLTEKAYALNPNHQVVLSTLAGKCFLFDEKDRFSWLFEQNKERMANSPLRLGAWGMHMCLFGEWERGKDLLDQVFENNLHVPLWLYGITCLYYFRLHDYETALVEANKLRIPGLFWGPAYRTALLGHLGRLAEAEDEYKDLLECRPDFVEKGRGLMGCYIREPGLLDHVLEGFEKIGVSYCLPEHDIAS